MAQLINVGDLDSIPGLGRSPGEGKGYPLLCSGLENSMDCIIHGVAKSQTQLSNFHLLTCIFNRWSPQALSLPSSPLPISLYSSLPGLRLKNQIHLFIYLLVFLHGTTRIMWFLLESQLRPIKVFSVKEWSANFALLICFIREPMIIYFLELLNCAP